MSDTESNSRKFLEWLKEEKKGGSDSWMWRLITKHFAYGLNVPVQLGSFDNLSNLHNFMIDFLDNKIKDNNVELSEKNYFLEIKNRFSEKEYLDKFVTDIFISWNEVTDNFKNHYSKMLSESGDLIIANTCISEFFKSYSAATEKFKSAFCERDAMFFKLFKKMLNYLERMVWKTSNYYSTPLASALGYYSPWRWFILLWFYYQLVLESGKASQGKEQEALNNQEWENIIYSHNNGDTSFLLPFCQVGCAIKTRPVNDERLFFFFGPVFPPMNVYFDDNATYRHRIKPTLLLFKIFQMLLDKQTNNTFSKALTQADIFLKACGTKPYLYREVLEQNLRQVGRLIDILLSTEIINFKWLLDRSDRHYLILISLLRWSIFLIKFLQSDCFNFFKAKFPYCLVKGKFTEIRIIKGKLSEN